MFNIFVQEFADSPMTPDQLYRAVVFGKDSVEAPQVFPNIVHARVTLDPTTGMIHMIGYTGTHSLNLTYTNKERLHAHWTGFKELNEISLRAARIAQEAKK